jgi:5-(carboxyamino)imidazole ribonucleotide mutase
MLAAKTTVPVLGVPVASRHLQGVDSLYSIVQMPKGVPVATFAIGNAGAANAALFAVAMLAVGDPALRAQLDAFRLRQTQAAQAMTLPPGDAEPVSPFSPQGGGAL